MSRLLKAASSGALIKPLPQPAGAAPHAPAARATPDPQAALRDRIATLEAELRRAAAELPKKLGEAREKGKREGLEERDRSAAERLKLLEQLFERAASSWGQQLLAANALSVEIARNVLERMIGNPAWKAEFAEAAIAARMARLDRGSILSIRVSTEDFGEDVASLLELDSPTPVTLDPSLKSGDCRIQLTMGEIELGAPAQWRRAAKLLDEIAEDRC